MDEADKKIDNTKPYNKYYDTYDVQGISFAYMRFLMNLSPNYM